MRRLTPPVGSADMTPEAVRHQAAPMTVLSVIGLSHKTARVGVRERLAFSAAEMPAGLSVLRGLSGMRESLLLSTCNRTEVYAVTDGEPAAHPVLDPVCAVRGVDAAELNGAVYVHRDTDAARHALRVAVGLDSMVVGEEQILGQLRRAFEQARAAGNTGPILNRLAQVAIVTGRRVRRETGLNRHSPSVPREALALVRRVVGSLKGRRIAVVGAGKVAALTIDLFAGAGARISLVANRTVQAAVPLAASVGAEAAGLDAMAASVPEVDVLVVCTGASRPVVSADMLVPASGRAQPLLVIDLGVPRGVDPEAAGLPGVRLYDLDDLGDDGAVSRATPADLARADEIVEGALAQYERWMRARAAAPLIAALRSRATAIVDGELARSQRRLRGLDDEQHDAVRAVLDAAVRKLLHAPIVHLREAAARRDALTLEAASHLFGLRDERPSSAQGGS
jgi:glutamyl-tRNA reductase